MVYVFFSRPKHDNTLSYLHHYSKELIKLAKDFGHTPINKEHIEANKKNAIKIITKRKPKLIMFNGHGSPEVICGHNNEIIVSLHKNPELLKDAITYSFSCCSASDLGKKSVKMGAICFIGYKFDFALGKDPESEATPHRDRIAKLFMEPSNLLFIRLLMGSSSGHSIRKAKELMKENIWYLRTTKDFLEASHYAPFLYGNYLGLVALGDSEASIYD